MIFVKTFKGYEDKIQQLDAEVNRWIGANRVNVVDIKSVLSHEPGAKHGTGDLLYMVMYKAERPLE